MLTPWEYIDVKQEKRVERTLSYVERYGDSGYVDSAILLDEAVNNQHAELSKLLKNSDLSTAELESGYAVIILNLFKDPKLSLSMNSVLRFHEELVQDVGHLNLTRSCQDLSLSAVTVLIAPIQHIE